MRHAVRGGLFRLRKRSEPRAPEPTELSAPEHANHAGVLRFDEEHLHVPEALAAAGEYETESLMPGRVVIIITVLAVVFIALIAWFVSQMPAK